MKHGLASRPVDWPRSSLHRYIRQGIVPPNWAFGVDEGQFGVIGIPDPAMLHPGYDF